MHIETIRTRLKDGFRPFAMQLTNGRRFEVPHPEFVMFGRRVVVVLEKNDVATTIDAAHIATVEDLPQRRRRSP